MQTSDLYSRIVCANVFDALYEVEFLARPIRLRPNTAAAMPEAADDFRTWTVRLRPGILFDDDPAFGGRPRELVAEDYVYAFKRIHDPRWKSPSYQLLASNGFIGLEALRERALATGRPFDYDTPVEGVRALDRHTIRFRLERPNPRFALELRDPGITGAVAREVVERWGDRIGEHPVGTGAYRLVEWRRSSRLVFEKNPRYREQFYAEEAPADDALARAAVARLAGRRLPLVDRVEISIVEQPQPRWLAFLNGEHDLIAEVPDEFMNLAMPNGRVAPSLAKDAVYAVRYPLGDVFMTTFSMEDPVVGGEAPAQVALRRAIGLACDLDEEIRFVRNGQAIRGQSLLAPGLYGYDPTLRSEMGTFDRARAQGLLDLYGFVDRDGDGWRERPDGSPLRIEYATQPDDLSRRQTQQFKKNLDAIGIRMTVRTAQWPENLKASRAGRLMLWDVGWTGGPDAKDFLVLARGPEAGQSNHARFRNAEYDRLFDAQAVLPDGPERLALIRRMMEIAIAHMPYKVHAHRFSTDLARPWLVGYHRNVFKRDFWRYVDIDPAHAVRHPA